MYNSKITGMGHYVPENIVTNNDLSQLMDTTDEWIQERTGINQRRLYRIGGCYKRSRHRRYAQRFYISF